MSRRLGVDRELESGLILSLAKLKALVTRLPPSVIRPSLKPWDVLEPLLQRELQRLKPAHDPDDLEHSGSREQPSDVNPEVCTNRSSTLHYTLFF